VAHTALGDASIAATDTSAALATMAAAADNR
jgi:hypothetical protein